MVTPKQYVLDIAMNLTRIGNWAADGFEQRQERIVQFLKLTKAYTSEIQKFSFNQEFQPTIEKFIPEFRKLYREGIDKPKDTDYWAEKMMTWGNILTHRAALL